MLSLCLEWRKPDAGDMQVAGFKAAHCPCTIVGTRLYLLLGTGVAIGTLTGGNLRCDGFPGEVSKPSQMNNRLDHITVQDDSIWFALAEVPFTFWGRIFGDSMSGQVRVPTPFCQCSDPYVTGTWTATQP